MLFADEVGLLSPPLQYGAFALTLVMIGVFVYFGGKILSVFKSAIDAMKTEMRAERVSCDVRFTKIMELFHEQHADLVDRLYAIKEAIGKHDRLP